MKDSAELMRRLSECCRRAPSNADLVQLGRAHMVDVVDALTAGDQRDGRTADDVRRIWQVCSVLSSVAENHDPFVEAGGVGAAFSRLMTSSDDDDVIVHVLMTVHEVSFTHGALLVRDDYLSTLVRLLDSQVQGISYLSCLILACLLHKDHLDTCPETITKDEIVAAMTQAIGRWRIDSSPIVEMEHFGIQAKYLSDDRHAVLVYLASWQLNHYTSHDVALYGLLAFRDLDTTLLKTVARDPRTADVTRQLLEQVLRRFHGDEQLADYVNAKTFLRSVLAEAEPFFENQEKSGLFSVGEKNMADVLRILSSLEPSARTRDKRLALTSSERNRLSSDPETSLSSDDEPPFVRNAEERTIAETAVDEGDCSSNSRQNSQSENGNDTPTSRLDNAATSECPSGLRTADGQRDTVDVDGNVLPNGSPSARPTWRSLAAADLGEDAWKICYIITWSCKYNQTFVDGGGVAIAERQLGDGDGSASMLTYLLGTLYNLSYTHSDRLLRSDIVRRLTDRLTSPVLDVSLFCCQILARMLKKHHDQWPEDAPSVRRLMDEMMGAIDGWQIDAECAVYSQEMLLADKEEYLSADHLPAVQFFIVWQLWYSVRQPIVYPSQIVKDDDFNKMKSLVSSEKTDPRIKGVLSSVVDFYRTIEKTKTALSSMLKAIEFCWQTNDRKALRALCQKHLTSLLAVLDRRSTSAAEDVVSNVWQIFCYLSWASANHKYFVDGRCLDVAFECLERWKHLEHITENILLTLYLVARTHSQHLTRRDYLDSLLDSLSSSSQRISYVSCHVLARILHKMTSKRLTNGNTEKQLTANMERAIDSWSLDSDLPINIDIRHVCYLSADARPVLQYLMAWVLYSSVRKDASKNCVLIVRYVGISLLTHIINDLRTANKVKVLLEDVLQSCHDRADLAAYMKMQSSLQMADKEDLPEHDDFYIKVVLEFLTTSLTSPVPDQLLEHGWQICYDLIKSGHHQEAFVAGNGLDMALKEFCEREEADDIRKLTGDIVYRITEHRTFCIINAEHLQQILEALSSPIQIVSYLSSRILCHAVYKGPRHWCLDTPTKDDVICAVRTAMTKWNLDCDMEIKSERFTTQREYLLSYQQLLQEFAIWELCYYTRRHRQSYTILVRDVGLALLNDLQDSANLSDKTKTMVDNLLANCLSKDDLRLYAREKDTLRAIFAKIQNPSADPTDDGRSRLAEVGQDHLSDVLATLASSQAICLPDDITDDAWTLCDMLTCHPLLNDHLFVNSGGLLIAFKALQHSSGYPDRVRRILRILHRAALRHAFAFVRVIHLDRLLELLRNGAVQDISFLACRLLARILFKASRDWDLVKPTRDEVALQMFEAIDGWSMTSDVGLDNLDQLDVDEQISYLLSGMDQPVLQYFGAWHLCHVMCWNPNKYYRFVIDNIGIDSLQRVIDNVCTDEKVKILLQYVINSTLCTESSLEAERSSPL